MFYIDIISYCYIEINLFDWLFLRNWQKIWFFQYFTRQKKKQPRLFVSVAVVSLISHYHQTEFLFNGSVRLMICSVCFKEPGGNSRLLVAEMKAENLTMHVWDNIINRLTIFTFRVILYVWTISIHRDNQSVWCCSCGIVIDRDYNAALNIKNEGLKLLSWVV